MKGKTTIILLALLFLCASTLGFTKNFTVIVHPDNPTQTLTAKDLKRIFLGDKTTWPEGEPLKIAALKNGEVHKAFLKSIVKLSPMKFAIHWKQKIFTGSATGSHINFFKSEAKVKEYVKDNPTAIGYISVDSVDDTIKEIKISK
ncbi:MAG: substrate-binding domain-containing protein [Candidatus Aminicenantes bacterium]|jgi:ABC-type phosphate transport system substrate-binding protein